MQLEYYLALLQLHVAVVSVVIAGIIALVQMLNNAKPHRTVRLLIGQKALVLYGVFLAGLLVMLALGAWVSAFPEQAGISFGDGLVAFFGDGRTGLAVIGLSLATLVWFADLAIRGRTLLDSHAYLVHYVSQTAVQDISRYLEAIYDDTRKTTPADPFQPIREYTKDNAYQYYDYGTADGLKLFSRLFDKAYDSIDRETGQNEYLRLARYISESLTEFFMIFNKTNSEKRKMDTIRLLHDKGQMLLAAGNDPSLLPVVRGLEAIAQHSDDDDEIIAVIESIRQLCDAFLDKHQQHDWAHVAGPFDEICLSVTRITETYYLHKNNSLKTVPIIGYTTGKHRTVTAALVDFFCNYQDLGDRYTDTKPVLYFEAIESVVEVLFMRLADITANKQQDSGFNIKYFELAHNLYTIYYTFGTDAIEHDKPELLSLALSNLRRVIKPAKNFALKNEQSELSSMVVELSVKGIAAFGDIVIKGERTISDYSCETLAKHSTQSQIDAALSTDKFTQPVQPPEAIAARTGHQKAVARHITRLRSLIKR